MFTYPAMAGLLKRTSPAVVVLAVSAALATTACTPAAERPADSASGGVPPSAAAPRSQAASPAPAEQHPSPAADAIPGVAGEPQPASTANSCPAQRRWGTAPRGASMTMTAAALYQVRAGQHGCYDRLAFDLNGPAAVGYYVRYVPIVTADASGRPVRVRGGAALEVVVRGPVLGADNQGHQPSVNPPALGADLVPTARLANWASLTQVAFAGSFEGQTTVAVGVRERRPFRVWTSGDRGYRHVIVDIAH